MGGSEQIRYAVYYIHILDDFRACSTNLQNFLHFCEDLEVLMAPEKARALSRFCRLQA